MIINHVMSNMVYSKIFLDILNRFKNYSRHTIVASEKPISNADVYHYHRINLENIENLCYPCICTVHHDLYDIDKTLSINLFIDKYLKMNSIVCLNRTQKTILEKYGCKNIKIIPHGYDQNIFVPNHKCQKNKISILVISRRYGRGVKGEAYLKELLQYLDNSKISFTLVGEDRTKDYNYFLKFGFECNVHEKLPYKSFGSLYNSHDFLLVNSTFEGGPANVPEAIATGTPILATEVGMIPDILEDFNNGIVLSGNAYLDSIKLNSIFEDINKIRLLQNNCLKAKNIKKVITWRKNIELYDDLYEVIK